MKSKGYYILKESEIIAAGGIEDFKIEKFNSSGYKTAQIWLLLSNKAKNHKQLIFKYVKKYLNCGFLKYDILFNFIYKSNFKALKWIKKCTQKGFIFSIYNTLNPDLKLFYFKRGDIKIDSRYFTCK